MRKQDLPELSQRLTQLAEALGARAPGPAGLIVWLDALSECAMPDVLAVLTDWPRNHSRMPLPADVLRLARERVSQRIERAAAEQAQSNRQPWDVVGLRCPANSAAYREFVAAFAEIRRRPRPHPRAWAERLRDRELAGERLLPVQREMWRDALGVRRGDDSEDDGEARARVLFPRQK